jgi:probable phosphoglycerate mutase
MVTNNQAEYRTLLAGLQAALDHARAMSLDPATLTLEVRTDSKLVVEQVLGRWKVRHPPLVPLSQQARELLGQFGCADVAWWPRARTVKVLGH